MSSSVDLVAYCGSIIVIGRLGDHLGLGRHGLDLDVAGPDGLVGLDHKALADEGGGHGSHLRFRAVRTVCRGSAQ